MSSGALTALHNEAVYIRRYFVPELNLTEGNISTGRSWTTIPSLLAIGRFEGAKTWRKEKGPNRQRLRFGEVTTGTYITYMFKKRSKFYSQDSIGFGSKCQFRPAPWRHVLFGFRPVWNLGPGSSAAIPRRTLGHCQYFDAVLPL